MGCADFADVKWVQQGILLVVRGVVHLSGSTRIAGGFVHACMHASMDVRVSINLPIGAVRNGVTMGLASRASCLCRF